MLVKNGASDANAKAAKRRGRPSTVYKLVQRMSELADGPPNERVRAVIEEEFGYSYTLETLKKYAREHGLVEYGM